MLPNIELMGLSLSTYWLALTVGAIGMLICLWQRRMRFFLRRLQCVQFILILTVIGILGAKALFILENLEDTAENGISLAGVSFYGSVYLLPLLMPLMGKLFQLRSDQTMDICGPCVAVMIGCMRIGCFLSGCCGGSEVYLGDICFQWPTQAFESIGDFAILLLLLHWEERGKYRQLLYPIFMLLYSALRFLIEFLRDTPKEWLQLSHGHWFALAAICWSAIWIFSKTYVKRTI